MTDGPSDGQPDESAVRIRPMEDRDAKAYLEVHRYSIRGLAAADYSDDVIKSWSRLPITERDIENAIRNPGNETRFVAEEGDLIVGIGSLQAENNAVMACYVLPDYARRGIASALLEEVERTARELGITRLQLDSSLTAEIFYASNGYEVVERATFTLGSGVKMPCVRMRKDLGD